MTILIVGGGGREHALAWKLAQSKKVQRLLCVPGNAGTAKIAENFAIAATDLEGIVDVARREKVDFVVVGPDDPLAAGLVDMLQAAGIRAFGPKAEAAQFEASKSFAKDFMRRHGIPTAKAEVFTDFEAVRDYVRGGKFPVVIKADGLALGKGVTIAEDFEVAEAALEDALVKGLFGDAGRKVVVEECLEGPEVSIHALVDGTRYLLFPDARDHKRALDGDRGPNTGGMGTLSPSGRVDAELRGRIEREILVPFLKGLREEGLDFRGMLFPGLMLTADGPKVLEFNARFGDPETQVLLPRLKGDLLELLEATVDGRLDEVEVEWDERTACCVVMTSGGYPGSYRSGFPILGCTDAEEEGAIVFHAGTKLQDGAVVTSGGRVLGVTALGDGVEAIGKAYDGVRRIHFENAAWRGDIGA